MSKREEHKKHHFVPQTYLRQFAHSNGKEKNPTYYIYGCNRKAHKPFTMNVENICQIPYFYKISDEYLSQNPENGLNPLSLELDYFANYVETNLTQILEEINSRKEDCVQRRANSFPMLDNDKYLLAEQVVIQFLRHPNMREYDVSFVDELYPKMIRLFQQGLARELNMPDIAKLKIGYKKDDVVLHAKHSYLNDNIVSSFAKHLSNNLWSFVYSPDKRFMTSDNPVVCIQQFHNERPFDLGLNQKGAIKFFALSPDLLLIMMDENITQGIDCKFGIATDICISTYHDALYSQSNEVYSYLPFDNKFTL